MAEPEKSAAADERSWLPLALAGGFVAFSVLVAVLVNMRGDDGEADPSTARTVLDVASLTVAAVEDGTVADYEKVKCEPTADQLTPYLRMDVSASYDHVTGVQTGAFRLVLSGDASAELDVTVEQDGDRSCVATATIAKATQ